MENPEVYKKHWYEPPSIENTERYVFEKKETGKFFMEVLIGEEDFLIRKAKLMGSYVSGQDEVKEEVEQTMYFSNFNQPVKIELPID